MAISDPSDIPGFAIDLDPHAEAYEDAAGTTASEVDGPVGRLTDQTGNGRHFTQSTSGAKPTLREDANGWRYVESDGVDDRMNAVSEYLAGRTEATVAVVFVANSITGNHGLMGASGGGSSGNEGWAILVDNEDVVTGDTDTVAVRNYIAEDSAGDAAAASTGDSSISTGTRYVVAGAYDTGDPEAWLSGMQQDTDTSDQSDIDSRGTQEAILNGEGFLVSLDGDLYRLLVYDHALTSTEHSDLYTYLDDLYSSPPPDEAVSVSVADTISLADTRALAATANGSVSDSVTFADARGITVTANGQVADSLGLADAIEAALTANASVAGALGLLDNRVEGNIFAETVSDSLTLTDAVAGTLTLSEAVADALSLADNSALSVSFDVALTDSITYDDALEAALSVGAEVSDAVQFADALTHGGSFADVTLPDERTLRIDPENRTITIAAENRTITA